MGEFRKNIEAKKAFDLNCIEEDSYAHNNTTHGSQTPFKAPPRGGKAQKAVSYRKRPAN